MDWVSAPGRVRGDVGWDGMDFEGDGLGWVLHSDRGRTACPYEGRTACSLASMTKRQACTPRISLLWIW